MHWIKENAAAISALGSIVMNISTVVIIFFNINQFKLNRRSLNIEINFRLFELRKKLYSELNYIFEFIFRDRNFSILMHDNKSGPNEKFISLKKTVENSEYIFSKYLYNKLHSLLYFLDQGVEIEAKIESIKAMDDSSYSEQAAEELSLLYEEIDRVLNSLEQFEINEIAKYLNISDFHRDFIDESASLSSKFSHIFMSNKDRENCSKWKKNYKF